MQVFAQEHVGIAHQLLQTRQEVRAKDEEIRQAEDHAAKLELELERKNLEVTVLHHDGKKKDDENAAIKVHVRHQTEKINELQSQLDSLQQELEILQHKSREEDIRITAITKDSQDQIEALEIKKQELISRMESLEARCREAEFYRDIYSLEVDQLRGDLMDKIAEIHRLRTEKENQMLATASASSPLGNLILTYNAIKHYIFTHCMQL